MSRLKSAFTENLRAIKVIPGMLRLIHRQSPVSTWLMPLETLVDNGKTLLNVAAPALVLSLILNGRLTDAMLVVFAYALLITALNMVTTSLRLKMSAESYRLANMMTLKVGQKGMTLDYPDFEDEDVLDDRFKAITGLWEFSEVSYIILHDLLGGILIFAAMCYIMREVSVLVLCGLLVLIVINMILSIRNGRAVHDAEAEEARHNRKAEYTAGVMYDLTKVKEVKMYSADTFLSGKFKRDRGELEILTQKRAALSFKGEAVSNLLMLCQGLLVYGAAIFRYAQGGMQISSFLLFLSAIRELNQSASGIFASLVQLKTASLYYYDYIKYMDRDESMRSGRLTIGDDDECVIRFENVSFRYPAGGGYALKDINLELRTGQCYAVVGENGSGKSTFVKLLQRLYDPTEGRITLNGVDIREYDYDSCMSIFSPVFQDYQLHEFTIRENVGFEDGRDESIWDVLAKNGLEQIVRDAPNALDTFLTKTLAEDGVDFSQGQRQRLAIARSEHKQAGAVVWDEPTSALDPYWEDTVLSRFKEVARSKVGVFISHRMSSSRLAQSILVFDRGEIVESGGFSQLMEAGGMYAAAYKKQSAYYVNDNLNRECD